MYLNTIVFKLNFLLFLIKKSEQQGYISAVQILAPLQAALTCACTRLQQFEQGYSDEAELLEGHIAVAVAYDKLEGQVEALCAASVEVEGDTTKLDEYLSGKSEVVAECRCSHRLCFAPRDVTVAEIPTVPIICDGVAGDSQAVGVSFVVPSGLRLFT